MSTGWKERIQQAFAVVHDDLAKILREEVKPAPVAKPTQVEKSSLVADYTVEQQQAFEKLSQALGAIACKNTPSRPVRNRLVSRCWWAGNLDAPAPDVERLYAEALRSLGVEDEDEKRKGAAA